MSTQHAETARRQMEAEIADLQAHLAAIEAAGTSFTAQLLRQQTVGRIEALESEMLHLEEDTFDLSFSERATATRHTLSTSVLANLLSRFQKALTYAGWAQIAGPGVSGRPPSGISRSLETEVAAFAPGSFVVALNPHDQALEHDALHEAFSAFLTLAAAGATTPEDSVSPDDSVAVLAQGLGAESTRRFALFFSKVHEAQLETTFQWRSHPEATVSVRPEQAKRLSEWLNAVEQQFTTIRVEGTLTAADTNDGRFAVTDRLGEIHEGRAAPELLTNATIDAQYVAQIRVTTFKSTVTGAARERGVLESLQPIVDGGEKPGTA